MTNSHVPLLIEIESSAVDAAMAAFVAWAGGRSKVTIKYTPDVLLAIDASDRRGWLYDEVYFVTVWIDRGAAAFRAHLESSVPPNSWSEKAPNQERDPIAFLELADPHDDR